MNQTLFKTGYRASRGKKNKQTAKPHVPWNLFSRGRKRPNNEKSKRLKWYSGQEPLCWYTVMSRGLSDERKETIYEDEKINCRTSRSAGGIWRYLGYIGYKCLPDIQAKMASSLCPCESGIQKHNEDRDVMCQYTDGQID